MNFRYDVVTFGEMMQMFIADGPGPLEAVRTFHKRTAGAETNVAIGLARLGLRVGWGSRLGTDSSGPGRSATIISIISPKVATSSRNAWLMRVLPGWRRWRAAARPRAG